MYKLKGGRFLCITSIIRVNQIEASYDNYIGNDESEKVTLANAVDFREGILESFPDSKITWALSSGALNSTLPNFVEIRAYVKACHEKYGDDISYHIGGYFANAYAPREKVNREIDMSIELLRKFTGDPNYIPKSIIAGFLSSDNQKYLAEKYGVHVTQGNIWNQYAIDNQDGEGSIIYPYYVSSEHFCKPAQGKSDFVDSVNLDGWSCDLICSMKPGCCWEYNSRLGVGPIETIMTYGVDVGVAEQMETTAYHFDRSVIDNGFAYVPVNWELSLYKEDAGSISAKEAGPVNSIGLRKWLREVRERWPDTKIATMGDFGLLWRSEYKNNDKINYVLSQKGTGIGGSHRWLYVKWYFNKSFRLGLLHNRKERVKYVMDFTLYTDTAAEPRDKFTRRWSIMGRINQKGIRPQDKPVPISELPEEYKKIIADAGIDLNTAI